MEFVRPSVIQQHILAVIAQLLVAVHRVILASQVILMVVIDGTVTVE